MNRPSPEDAKREEPARRAEREPGFVMHDDRTGETFVVPPTVRRNRRVLAPKARALALLGALAAIATYLAGTAGDRTPMGEPGSARPGRTTPPKARSSRSTRDVVARPSPSRGARRAPRPPVRPPRIAEARPGLPPTPVVVPSTPTPPCGAVAEFGFEGCGR